MAALTTTERRQRAAPVPEKLLRSVVAYFNPVRVILFGSHARGEAGPDSDYDLLVVLDDDAPAEKRTLRAGFEAAGEFPLAVDVVPVRARRFAERSRAPGTLSHTASTEGVVVYERGSRYAASAAPPRAIPGDAALSCFNWSVRPTSPRRATEGLQVPPPV